MSVSPAPETTAAPVAWRGLAWAALPPLLVLALRALMPGEVDAGALQRLETATLVSDPAEAFWMAARPLALGLLVLAVAAGACLFAVRRWVGRGCAPRCSDCGPPCGWPWASG